MSISRLKNGRYRVQIHDGTSGHNVSISTILGPGYTSFKSKAEAKDARELARRVLNARKADGVTVEEFRQRWLTDPLFARRKPSTLIHNTRRTQAFTDRYGGLLMSNVGDGIVAEWLAGGNRRYTVASLKAMWNDAMSAKAGRLVDKNPWLNLGLKRTKGNRDTVPPSEETVWALIRKAREVVNPGFAAWLQVGAFTGMRLGELDALRWERVDLENGLIRVVEQFNSTARVFTAPKNGKARVAPLTGPARDALIGLPRDSEFCFTNLSGGHWTDSGRREPWARVRAAVGYDGTLYLAVRHFAGAFMVNTLGLASEDVAIALGHEDGGELVRRLYGHRDRDLALERVRLAYASAGNVLPLRVVEEEGA